MDKLTLEHLAPYLPYEVQGQTEHAQFIITGATTEEIIGDNELGEQTFDYEDVKLRLIPLSYFEDINSKSMNDLNTDLEIQMEICDFANKGISYYSLSYGTAMECFANHIDVFGLIEKGLAISTDTLGKEVKG